MAKPSEMDGNETELSSDRRNLMKAATAVGMMGAAGIAPQMAAAQQAEVQDPQKPAGLGPEAWPDARFPMFFETSVPEAMKLATQYMAALSRRDLAGLSRLFHYPFVTYEGIDTVIVNSREELMANPPPSLNTTGKGSHKIRPGSYDVMDKIELVMYTPIGVGILLDYSRFNANGKKLLGVYGIYGMTNNDGKWGIEYMSTIFRPAEQLHLTHDAEQFAERSIHDNYRDNVLARKYGTGRDFITSEINPGKWGGVSVGPISTPLNKPEGWQMDPFKVKGVKSRLRVSTITVEEATNPDAAKVAAADQDMIRFRTATGGAVGTWYQSTEWSDPRVLKGHADMEKAHTVMGNQRFAADGTLINQSLYMSVCMYRNKYWTAADGPSIFGRQMYQDRSNDLRPPGI